MARRVVGLILVFVLAGCASVAPSPIPSETETAGDDGSLYLENRGGPTFTVRIGGADVVTVRCNGGERITPGQLGVPQLPWELTVVRVRDEVTVYSRTVRRLPGWFVQIGSEVLGLSESVILGPMGPTCPPSG